MPTNPNIIQIQEDSGSMSTTSNYRKHPAKKLVCLLLTLTLLLTLSAAAFAAGTHEISDGAFPLYANSMNTGMEMKLYFLDGVGDLPYMEVTSATCPIWRSTTWSRCCGCFSKASSRYPRRTPS